MGLDMYLYGATWKFNEETRKVKITLDEVAYWRKQNAIHNWIVQNVQNGVDNCAMYYLDERHLKKLLLACRQVLEKPTVETAMKILPTKEGFFFGGTDLTDNFEFEYYLDGLKYTVKTIRELLENGYEYYYYTSSW